MNSQEKSEPLRPIRTSKFNRIIQPIPRWPWEFQTGNWQLKVSKSPQRVPRLEASCGAGLSTATTLCWSSFNWPWQAKLQSCRPTLIRNFGCEARQRISWRIILVTNPNINEPVLTCPHMLHPYIQLFLALRTGPASSTIRSVDSVPRQQMKPLKHSVAKRNGFFKRANQ